MIETVHVPDIENDIEWKEFLRNQYNLFYDNKFLCYHDEFGKSFNWHHLKFRDLRNNKVLAIINGTINEKEGVKTFVSCDGVSFGGFLWKTKANVVDYLHVIKSFKKYLKDNGFGRCIIRAFPFLYYRNANEENEYALTQEGFEVTKNSITNIIDLSTFDFKKISETKKRVIRRSQSKIRIEILESPLDKEMFANFYSVLLNDREQKDVKPTHSMDELIYLKHKFGKEIILFSATIDEKIIGICVLFQVNPDIILNFYLASDNDYNDEGVSDLILYKSIEWSKNNGYKLYDIGTSDVNNKLSEGLFSFKKRFLANGFLRKTFELNNIQNN
jgi:hypothetical protein